MAAISLLDHEDPSATFFRETSHSQVQRQVEGCRLTGGVSPLSISGTGRRTTGKATVPLYEDAATVVWGILLLSISKCRALTRRFGFRQSARPVFKE